MRTILFTGKAHDDGKWYVGNLEVNSIGDTWISEMDCGEGDRGFFKNVICSSVGQFTGFFDIDNNMIFENCIVKHTSNECDPTPAVVVFENGCFSTKCTISGELGKLEGYSFKIIGNTTDNWDFTEDEYNNAMDRTIQACVEYYGESKIRTAVAEVNMDITIRCPYCGEIFELDQEDKVEIAYSNWSNVNHIVKCICSEKFLINHINLQ